MQEACGHVRWLMELDAGDEEKRKDPDPVLWMMVKDWLLETRRSPASVWEAELSPDDWAKVSGPRPNSSQAFKRKVLDKLILRRLASQDVKLDTALRIAAHLVELDRPDDVEVLRQYRDKGSTTERRRWKRGE
jgi:hypothetical protein